MKTRDPSISAWMETNGVTVRIGLDGQFYAITHGCAMGVGKTEEDAIRELAKSCKIELPVITV
jgi:hypothetical protein